ncbi:OprD family outer membrane porin, partial [Sulfuricurvum sp.]|uniref:OprD family outer membrane porin n=1 Tax=Sulfuricurvum sp. TaxID=2025608 RepID=UPI002609DAAC
LLLISIATVAELSASSIDEAFVTGKVSGQIRAAYSSIKYDAAGNDYGTSLGGIMKYQTADWYGVKLGIAAYVSQKIHVASGDADKNELNNDLFDINGKSYVYIGEAYLDYTMGDLNLKVGRQLLDTPFADTDDIRMHPNTFEAAIATYTGFEGTTLVGGYVTRWAGYDSEDTVSKDKYKKLSGDQKNGVAVVGILNESIDNLALQGWYYNIDDLSNAIYADATYRVPFSEIMALELSTQYANFSEEKASGVDGKVYGFGVVFNIAALTLGAAYNKASNDDGKAVSNGFGGGPYMTSMEEMTIEGMNDVKAYQLSAELDMANAGLEGVTLTALYGNFKSDTDGTKVTETDLIASMELSEAITGDISYAMIDDKNNNFDSGNDSGYDRFLVRLNYNF